MPPALRIGSAITAACAPTDCASASAIPASRQVMSQRSRQWAIGQRYGLGVGSAIVPGSAGP